MRQDEADPKGLVRESYRIEGITGPECRSIFIDWALSLQPGVDVDEALRAVLAEYALAAPDHPMSAVLTQALVRPDPPRRRGGRAARLGA
ncbi:hypothetical protein EEB11_02305 [Pseudotabrizicola sediminis]|uniref:Uncharacterized protein n=1 Tax=Pseudotabrizicola sediminis TaxID=2486418 RepID=A0ABY2KRN3_9RHOB|nr:hypothetical protein [Pseudotabrizicola sediminis]TGD45395.1 hypothetical protein EEB11_02305 [Pseudotabrizicola sediminis]TGD64019.1 hypothetical protein EYC08_11335 [Tabrizicola sp. WMC-M-20]